MGLSLLFCRERGGHSVDMAGRSMESSVRGSEARNGHVIRRRLALFWDMPLTWPSVNVFPVGFWRQQHDAADSTTSIPIIVGDDGRSSGACSGDDVKMSYLFFWSKYIFIPVSTLAGDTES